MNTVTFPSARRTDAAADASSDAVTDAVAVLGDLGAEIVDSCHALCEICGPVVGAAA